jgi:hypothetical protein
VPSGERQHLFAKKLPLSEEADKVPKALACYGLYLPYRAAMSERMLLRFVQERPVSRVTCQFLEEVCTCLQALGKRVLVLFWDNASWHISREVKQWSAPVGGSLANEKPLAQQY